MLIVDDDPDVRDVVRSTLENSGLKTFQAVNGRAAIDWLQSHPAPSLILLDLMMPEMDGFEFLNRIRDDDKLVDVPVVVLIGEGADRRGTGISRRTHAARAEQGCPADRQPRLGAVGHRQAARAAYARGRTTHSRAGVSLMPKILLVEDNEMNRDMLSRRLVRNGFEVVMAVDGGQAVTMAAAEKPDLILMDMSLPVMDGLEATRQVKAAPETRSIPIIALTANALVEDREKALAAGCDDFDTKPVELPRLLEKIRNKLGASDPPR